MFRKRKISFYQFVALVTLYTVGSTILVVPGSMAATSKQDAWIAAIIGVGVGLLLVWLYSVIGDYFPNQTLIELNETLLGKWLGKTVSFLFIFFTLTSCSQVVFYLGNFLLSEIMPETPMIWIHILFMIVVVMGVRLGIESLARCAEILFPFFIILFIILTLSTFPQIKVKNIQPILETGMKPIVWSTLVFLSIASLTLIVLLVVFPAHTNNWKETRKAFFIGHFIGGLIMVMIITLSIFVLGPFHTAKYLYPSYELARRATIGNFLERIEAILAIMWLFSLYIKTSLYFYATVLGLGQLLQLKDYRPLTFPVGMMIVIFSVIVYPDFAYQQKWDALTWVPYILTIGFFYPVLLLGAALFRKNHLARVKK